MTSKKRNEIRAWMREREQICKRHAIELGAKRCADGSGYAVERNGEWVKLETIAKDDPRALGLLVNDAYYTGAHDALYGFGIMYA